MTQQKVAEGEEAKAQGKPGYAPEWKKRFYPAWRIWLSTKVRRGPGGIARQSDITRWNMGVDGRPAAARPGQLSRPDRQFPAFSVRVSARTTADLVLKYSDRKKRWSATSSAKPAGTTTMARGISVNIDHQFQGGRYSLQAGWDRALSNRRVSVGDELVTFQPRACRNIRRAASGKEAAGQLDPPGHVDLDPIRTGAFTHIPYAGLEWQRVPGSNASSNHTYCRAYDNKGGYQDFSKVRYSPGTVDVNYDSVSAYRQTASNGNAWHWTPACAMTASFRHGLAALPPGLGCARLGRHAAQRGLVALLRFGSAADRAGGRDQPHAAAVVLDAGGRPVTDGTREYHVRYQGLRMPHDDEWAMSLRQRLAGIEGTLSYVHRNGRDQWTKAGNDTDGYRYTNDGRSTTDGVSLTLRPLEPWRLGETRWNLLATWSWQKRKTNGDLVKGYSGDARDPDDR